MNSSFLRRLPLLAILLLLILPSLTHADPLYTDAATGDLHLKLGSSCLGADSLNGIHAMGLNGNIRPKPPSMEAYELTPAPIYQITDLGTIPGSTRSYATAINNAGQIVGVSGNTGDHSFLWQNGKMNDLGVPPGNTSSDATAINDLDQIVGRTSSGHAFLWTQANGFQILPTDARDVGGTAAINNKGQIITVYPGTNPYVNDYDTSLLQYADGQITIVRNPIPLLSEAINDMGQVATNFITAVSSAAILWDTRNGQETSLGSLMGGDSTAVGVNHQGQVVGNAYAGRTANGYYIQHAFLWDATTGMQDIGTLGGDDSSAVAINSAGQIIGTADDKTGNRPPFVYSRGIMYNLSSLLDPASGAGWTLDAVTGINDLGQIVGSGTHNGQMHGFLLSPIGMAPSLITNFVLSPIQLLTSGPIVTADVIVTGSFSKVTVSLAPGTLGAASPTFTLSSNGTDWTGKIPTAYLKLAKTNPVTFIATGTRADGSTATATATLQIAQTLPSLALSLSPPSGGLVEQNKIIKFTAIVSNPSQSPAAPTSVTIALPDHVSFVSSPDFILFGDKTLIWIGSLGSASRFGTNVAILSFTISVDSGTVQNTNLLFHGVAAASGFQPNAQDDTLVVDGNALPQGVTVDDSGGFGILGGQANVDLSQGQTPLHATLTPVTSLSNILKVFGDTHRASIYLDVGYKTSGNAICAPGGDPIPTRLAELGLMTPSVSPSYVATFTGINDSVAMSVSFSTRDCLLTFADAYLSYLDIKTGKPIPTIDQIVSFADDLSQVSTIATAAQEFTKNPPTAKNPSIFWQDSAKATRDIFIMPSADKQLLLTILKKHGISVSGFEELSIGLTHVFAANTLLHMMADYLTICIATNNPNNRTQFLPMVIHFDSSAILTQQTQNLKGIISNENDGTIHKQRSHRLPTNFSRITSTQPILFR